MTAHPFRGRVLLAAAAAVLATSAVVAVQAGATSSAPGFTTYHHPDDGGEGEPSIGVSWKTGAVLYQSGTRTFKVAFGAHGASTWVDTSGPTTGIVTLDPILYTDTGTGRTYVSQLAADCSLVAYTDNDGASWTPSEGCGPGVYVDHQTLGSGPFSANTTTTPLSGRLYQHAVYYCAHAVVEAECARSDDGGLTFGPAVPIRTAAQCTEYHGHIRVAPDGTVYIPHANCGGRQGVVVSEDNGVTYTARTVDGSSTNEESDPSVAIGAGNTVYFGYQDGAGRGNTQAVAAVSHDHGRTWSRPVDVSTRLGLRNVQFPEMIAGDDDRAAFAFLGSRGGGDDQAGGFAGTWRLYIAMTYDSGRTWTTVDATPKELAQRGCIQLVTPCRRNLLDFNDIAVDKEGRVYVAWADGCPADCEKKAGTQQDWHGDTITRQTKGRGLFRAYDGRL